jgi:hypothetical protein
VCELPIYQGLCEELGDPEQTAREIDEFAIQWHAARMRAGPCAGDDPQG